MNRLAYNIFLFLFKAGVRIAALFNNKARLWLAGRKDIFQRLATAVHPQDRIIWIHCASLGEFEQGRPVLEPLRETHQGHKILLTFFSPSGYEIRKNYPGADWVFYLPMDGKRNAQQFLTVVKPELAIFVKYEFWYYYLNGLHQQQIPVLLISAIFRTSQPFFKWYGTLHRKMLACFTHLFVQDVASSHLLQEYQPGIPVSVAGDTRFDRVATLKSGATPIPLIENWLRNNPVIVAGSTWPEDEKLLQKAVAPIPQTDLIVAPHEVNAAHIQQLEALFPSALLYSSLEKENAAIPDTPGRVLIIDNIGMLSRLYRYGKIAYIGGGFGKGIHNTLEAAVYGIPVIFGPAYDKFKEARDLVNEGAAYPVKTTEEASIILQKLLEDASFCTASGAKAGAYVQANTGASGIILNFIQEKRLLTN